MSTGDQDLRLELISFVWACGAANTHEHPDRALEFFADDARRFIRSRFVPAQAAGANSELLKKYLAGVRA